MLVSDKVYLLSWSSNDIYWGGWQGYSGVYTKPAYMWADLNLQTSNDRAEIIDYKTLKPISRYIKVGGKWVESGFRNGR